MWLWSQVSPNMATWKEGLKAQDHTTMNTQVLNNPLTQVHHNEQNVITRVRRHAFMEWDRLQVYLQYTHEVPKPALVKLASNHIFRLLGMIAWGVGAILFNVQAKLEGDEDLVLVIRMIQIGYVKALKGAWMEHD